MIINVWENDHLPKAFTWKNDRKMIINVWKNDHLPKAFTWKNDWEMIIYAGEMKGEIIIYAGK